MLDVTSKFDPFEGPELDCVVYTTKAQSEIWTACYLGGKEATKAYNESISIDFTGSLDVNSMDQAIQKLIERHESLRATFSTDGVYMSIFKSIIIEVSKIDVSNLEENHKRETIDQYIKEDINHLFDLVHGPLIKFGLITISDKNHMLVITVHHIICDGWSIGILLQDLGALYSSNFSDELADLPIPLRFSDYANEEQLFSESDENKENEKFWYEMYEKSIPVVNAPTDYPRPIIRTYKSQRLDFALDANLLSNLKQTGLSFGASLVTTLLVSFEVFLYQLTGQADIAIGLPSAGQAVTGMNHLVGHCVNLLPLRSKPNPKLSFLDYLKQRKSDLLDAYDHPRLSFGSLIQKLNVARDPSRIPLIPIGINIDMGLTDGVNFKDLDFKLTINPKAFEIFEIFLNVSGTDKNLVFEWAFNQSLFKPESINAMMLAFEKILKKIVEDPSKTLEQITFRNFTSDYAKINGPKKEYPKSTLHELFAKQVKLFPNSIAVKFNDQEITYTTLGNDVNQMANYLLSQGLTPGQIVAVSLERSAELITVLFAILQCGASYVPIDSSYPDNRVNLMIEDSKAAFYIGLNFKKNIPKSIIYLIISDIKAAMASFPVEPIRLKVATESAAYIIYTSGSTGKPKGVQVAHYNVINLIYSMAEAPGISNNDKVFALTTISFDPMVIEVYLPLLFGACIVIVDDSTRSNSQLLLKKAIDEKITFMLGTPSLWQMLIDSGWKTPLEMKVITGGEPLTLQLAQKLLTLSNELWNQYGPTETTVCSLLTKISINDTVITIGKPIANTKIYLLDENRNLLNKGEIGEIAIDGDGVSLGYLNRLDLTNERFVTNSFEGKTDSKMYLTGDLGKILPDGNILSLGRIDQQVKVRGYRIEIGEIEHSLMIINGIKSAIVVAKADVLVAFIVLDCKVMEDLDQIQYVRSQLEIELPSYMIPNIIHILEKMPTTLNEKIDRKALSDYRFSLESKVEYNAPRTEEESIIASIWKESLQIENVDIFSNFFEMGGHSIKAVKVIIELEKITGKRFPLSALFEHPTVEKFAKLLRKDQDINSDCLVPLKPSGNKTPLFIIHGAGLNVLNFVNLSNQFDADQPIYGIQGTAKEYDEWYESIEDMATHYIDAIIKINPNGPYALAGFSFGGVVAFEMTRQLIQQGKKVILTGLLDSYLDSSYYYQSYSQKKLIRYLDLTYKRLDFLKEMLLSWSAFKMRIKSKKEYILKKHFGLNNTMTDQEALALEQFIEADSMVKTIVDRYHIKPQNIEVDLFRSKDDLHYKLDPTHLGWKKAALKGVKIHNIPGNHLDILAPPNDKVLARMIQDILDKRHLNLILLFLQICINS